MKSALSTLSPHSAARTTAVRLLMAWVPLSLIVGLVVWFYQTERLERRVLADAVHDAQRIGAEDFDRYYRREITTVDLHSVARRVLGDFVSVEVYDAGGVEIAQELNERAALVTNALWAQAEAAELTDEPFYHPVDDIGRLTIITVVPVRGAGSEVLGYLKGIYIATDATLDEMREDSFGASLIAVGSMFISMLVVFPIILFMQREHAVQTRRVLEGNVALLEVLGNAVAHRDSDTDSHNYRVTMYALRLAEQLGLDVDRIRVVIVGAFLHDVGKIGIPDAILLKPGKLTVEEFEIMKTHVAIGSEIVKRSPWLKDAVQVVEYHHEKFDGRGYPRGMAGEDIPVEARVFAIADVFDALTSQRPYKDAFPIDEALAIMAADSGRHFDPVMLDCFQSIARELHRAWADRGPEELRQLMQGAIQRYLVDADGG